MSWKFNRAQLPKPARLDGQIIIGNLREGNPQLAPNFWANEFACSCCKEYRIHVTTLEGIQAIRDVARAAIHVGNTTLTTRNTQGSGYRCPRHNAAIGSSGSSEHVRGTAADLSFPSGTVARLFQLCEDIPAFRNGGLGRYRWGIHVDIGPRRRWLG